MNNRIAVFVVVVLFGATLVAPLQAAEYQLDPQHSSVVFKAKHMDIGYIYGMFLDQSGTIQYDPEKPKATEIELTIDAKSIFTNVKKRDNHLRSADFFNVKQYPEITFNSTSVEPENNSTLRVTGDLTMHGVTRELTTTVSLTGSGKGPQGKFRRGFMTELTVNRMNFGVDYMPDALSKEIKVIVTGEVIRQ